jgi:cytochrome c556
MPISVNVMRCRASRARPSAAALLLIAVISAAATESNPIIKARQENFKTLGRTAKALGDQIGRSSPDWVTIAENAKTVEQLATELPDWFPSGTGPQPGVKTGATLAIWTRPQEFKLAAQSFAEHAKRLMQVVQTNDLAAARIQGKALADTCHTCHHGFRTHD